MWTIRLRLCGRLTSTWFRRAAPFKHCHRPDCGPSFSARRTICFFRWSSSIRDIGRDLIWSSTFGVAFLYHDLVASMARKARPIRLGILCFAAVAYAQGPGDAARASITRYCTGCHNERARTGGLVLNPASLASPPETWEKVVRRLRM